jgi:hypothetical protein
MSSPVGTTRHRRVAALVRGRLSFANTLSVIALFVALGGASYAAVSLPRDSVGTQQLRAQAVTRAKLAFDSVGTRQLRDDSVDETKLAAGSVEKRSLSPWIRGQLARRAEDGSPGPRGEAGPRGATGPRGPGAVAVDYSAAASETPNPQTVLDVDGLSFSVSCDESGGTVTANFAARSAVEGTLNETVTVDSGLDAIGSGAVDFTGNLQIDMPAGTALETGGPSAAAGFTRVAVEAVYSAEGRTVYLHMFTTVDATAGKCSINGVAIPA